MGSFVARYRLSLDALAADVIAILTQSFLVRSNSDSQKKIIQSILQNMPEGPNSI